MDIEAGEFHDWEVLPDPGDSGVVNSSDSVSNMSALERDSEGIIRSDYFSLDSQTKYARPISADDVTDEDGSVSDNPSWIDPGLEMKDLGEFWSDSSSDRSDNHKFGEFEAKNELGFVENEETKHVIGEIGPGNEKSVESLSDSGRTDPISGKAQDELEFSGKDEVVENPNKEASGVAKNENPVIEALKSGGEEGNRGAFWWKLPFNFLKYCIFRSSPIWTISMAAAMMGFIILGRRLYKMKRKSRSFQLKVTVDDKKVSQFMSRAARLNEAFSVVKRVPIVRPSLPAAGVASWPMMSLR